MLTFRKQNEIYRKVLCRAINICKTKERIKHETEFKYVDKNDSFSYKYERYLGTGSKCFFDEVSSLPFSKHLR